jgi:UrcA family protein
MNAATFDSSTTNLQRRLPAGLLSALAATVMCATGGVAKADDAPAPASVTVGFQDLDVRTESGAQTLYRRIESAARRVCPDAEDSRRLDEKAASWSCRHQALTQAMDKVNTTRVATATKNPRMASAH